MSGYAFTEAELIDWLRRDIDWKEHHGWPDDEIAAQQAVLAEMQNHDRRISAAVELAAHTDRRFSFPAWAANRAGWDSETGCPGIELFGNAIQLWTIAQLRRRIAEDRQCYERFLRMEDSYLIDSGMRAEPR